MLSALFLNGLGIIQNAITCKIFDIFRNPKNLITNENENETNKINEIQ